MDQESNSSFSLFYFIATGLALGVGVAVIVIVLINTDFGPTYSVELEKPKSIEIKLPRVTQNDPQNLGEETSDPTAEIASVAVNSMDQQDQYPVSGWNAVAFFGGYVDTIGVDGQAVPAATPVRVTKNSILTLSGWAGHSEFGMKFPKILFTVCDTVIGMVNVTNQRPDVIANVHNNLDPAGWKADLATSHFPVCPEPVLLAWAMAPLGFNIFPLHGGRVIEFKESSQVNAVALANETAIGFIRPTDRMAPDMKTISVRASALRLRKCGGVDCPVLGTLKFGIYQGFVIESANSWSLIQIDGTVGWVATNYLNIDG